MTFGLPFLSTILDCPNQNLNSGDSERRLFFEIGIVLAGALYAGAPN
jgi:hypothetical protein